MTLLPLLLAVAIEGSKTGVCYQTPGWMTEHLDVPSDRIWGSGADHTHASPARIQEADAAAMLSLPDGIFERIGIVRGIYKSREDFRAADLEIYKSNTVEQSDLCLTNVAIPRIFAKMNDHVKLLAGDVPPEGQEASFLLSLFLGMAESDNFANALSVGRYPNSNEWSETPEETFPDDAIEQLIKLADFEFSPRSVDWHGIWNTPENYWETKEWPPYPFKESDMTAGTYRLSPSYIAWTNDIAYPRSALFAYGGDLLDKINTSLTNWPEMTERISTNNLIFLNQTVALIDASYRELEPTPITTYEAALYRNVSEVGTCTNAYFTIKDDGTLVCGGEFSWTNREDFVSSEDTWLFTTNQIEFACENQIGIASTEVHFEFPLWITQRGVDYIFDVIRFDFGDLQSLQIHWMTEYTGDGFRLDAYFPSQHGPGTVVYAVNYEIGNGRGTGSAGAVGSCSTSVRLSFLPGSFQFSYPPQFTRETTEFDNHKWLSGCHLHAGLGCITSTNFVVRMKDPNPDITDKSELIATNNICHHLYATYSAGTPERTAIHALNDLYEKLLGDFGELSGWHIPSGFTSSEEIAKSLGVADAALDEGKGKLEDFAETFGSVSLGDDVFISKNGVLLKNGSPMKKDDIGYYIGYVSGVAHLEPSFVTNENVKACTSVGRISGTNLFEWNFKNLKPYHGQ